MSCTPVNSDCQRYCSTAASRRHKEGQTEQAYIAGLLLLEHGAGEIVVNSSTYGMRLEAVAHLLASDVAPLGILVRPEVLQPHAQS